MICDFEMHFAFPCKRHESTTLVFRMPLRRALLSRRPTGKELLITAINVKFLLMEHFRLSNEIGLSVGEVWRTKEIYLPLFSLYISYSTYSTTSFLPPCMSLPEKGKHRVTMRMAEGEKNRFSHIGVEVSLDAPTSEPIVSVCMTEIDEKVEPSCDDKDGHPDSPVSNFRRDAFRGFFEDRNDGGGEASEMGSPLVPSFGDDSDEGRLKNGGSDEAENESFLDLDSSPSWDVRISKEIAKARRTATHSIVSDTGVDDSMHSLLRDSLTGRLADERRRSILDFSDRSVDSFQGRLRRRNSIMSVESPCVSPTNSQIADEKKETEPDRKTRVYNHLLRTRLSNLSIPEDELQLVKSLSMTESDVESVDGLPLRLRSQWAKDSYNREKILKNLDGVRRHGPSHARKASISEPVKEKEEEASFFGWPFNMFWGTSDGGKNEESTGQQSACRSSWRHEDDTLGLLGCANIILREERPPVAPSLVRVTSEPPPPSYAETIRAQEVDPRMQSWIESQFVPNSPPPDDGNYYQGKSRTVIVHEIFRGNWTWCTAWSPEGDCLAIATENHHLAIIDTTSSPVWRVKYDKKLTGPARNHTTHSIRSIAWGKQFIAIGGTGNAVSILSPKAPYHAIHKIRDMGFVGALDWKDGTSVLAIASRLEKAVIVRIREVEIDQAGGESNQILESDILHTIEYQNWVNAIAFNPGGWCLAVGDAGGVLSVYSYIEKVDDTVDVILIKSFHLADAVLDIEWSPDGKWLYAGGEDFQVSVIDTTYWEVVHNVRRQRWVQCISSSNSGTHMAVGGVSSEISILDVKKGWDSVMGIGLKGLVPLSAKWHPKDQYLAITGQNNSVVVVETTNARHVRGHHLQAISPILAIEFSQDGRMAVVGNKTGVVTFFALAGSTFETSYELVVTLTDRVSIKWSSNGQFVVVGSKDALIIVGRGRRSARVPLQKSCPPKASGLCIQSVFRQFGEINAVAIDSQSHYVAVSGSRTWILDATRDFSSVREWQGGQCLANAWSSDGRWLATIGQEKTLTIYDTGDIRVDRWGPIFSLKCENVGRAVAWGPISTPGLLYLAYGGDSSEITVIEIRTREGTWETVLRAKRDGSINSLDWSSEGLLAAAIGNGTVSIVDLSYLKSGYAVNEMDYNWQRQALTCFTEIRRNKGCNSMCSVRWIPSAPGSDSLLAVGGTDGELEIIDLTERRRCRGYIRGLK